MLSKAMNGPVLCAFHSVVRLWVTWATEVLSEGGLFLLCGGCDSQAFT